MSDIDTVKRLNSIFGEYDFDALRDAVEGSEPDAVRSVIAELDALVNESLADDVVIEFHGGIALPEGRRYEGREEYLWFWRGWLAAFDTYEIEHGDSTSPTAANRRVPTCRTITDSLRRCDSRSGRRSATTTSWSSATRSRGS